MSDNIATARSLHEEYGRKQCWEEQQEPIVSFCCDDGATCGFPFFHLSVARLTDDLLSLQRPGAVIEIRGPLAGEFYKDFAKHRGTWIKADGESIVSVKMFSPAEQAKVGLSIVFSASTWTVGAPQL